MSQIQTICVILTFLKLVCSQHPYYFDEHRPQQQQQQYKQQYQQQNGDVYLGEADPYSSVRDRYYETDKYEHEGYHEENEEYEPKPFSYEYGGADHDGRHFAKTETKDEDGVVKGEYRVELPDGRVQIVSYRADPVLGYQANVRYEGEARPEPVYQDDQENVPRKRFVPNYQHKPYARS